ncbi:MAG: M1 family metallopeptidase [Bacteroidia bacterium]
MNCIIDIIQYFKVKETARFVVSFLFILQTNLSKALASYFQQEVNYKIDVKLNDSLHYLTGFENIQYINKSSTSLDYIYIHLWPNAYKNHETALAKQLLKLKRTEFYYSEEKDRGYIDSLDFKVNGKKAKLEIDKVHIDIAKLILDEPLRSLDTINITTPFYVKIPSASFSRMGHTDQAYYITQWYPKPAVYDKSGWHPMPYLDQGEFYSEFGSFDVSITLPKNYIVASTGELVDSPEEEDFINANISRTIARIDNPDNFRFKKNLVSSEELKTVRYKQARIHDFAWFADKRFNILHDQISLPNTGKEVDTWTFFTDENFELWKDAIDYVNESTLFYSYMVGDYPYNQVSAVDGVLMAGGGMEYPNITVIGQASSKIELETTIAHEVGHNWFYGILGNNERDFPFLDEGMNSFYEMSYIRAKYPQKKLTSFIGLDSTFKVLGLNKYPYWKMHEVSYLIGASYNIDQPINLVSEKFTEFNYGSVVYSKSALIMEYLRSYLGEISYNKAIKFYYENFKFKHPSIDDFLYAMQYFSGEKLDWLKKVLLDSNEKFDFKAKKVKRNDDGSWKVKYKNKYGSAIPISLVGVKSNSIVGITWFNDTDSSNSMFFPPSDVDYFVIDGYKSLPELNRKNNNIRTRGIFRKRDPLQLKFITSLPDPSRTQVYWLPSLGYNLYNGLMAGLILHNHGLLEKKFEYYLAPMYAFDSKTPTGMLGFEYNIHPRKNFTKIVLGFDGKTFASGKTNPLNANSEILNYYKASPNIQLHWVPKDRTVNIQYFASMTANFFREDKVYYQTSETGTSSEIKVKDSYRSFYEANFGVNNNRIIHPFKFKTFSHFNENFMKVALELNQEITVTKKYRIDIRFFAGHFLFRNENQSGLYQFRMSGWNGRNDYAYEGAFIGRSEYKGFSSYQFLENDGAFKIQTPLGYSNTYLSSVSAKLPLFNNSPLKVYVEAGIADDSALNKNLFLWDAGLNFSIRKGFAEVYLPLVYSKEIDDNLKLNQVKFWETIRFTFNIHSVEIKRILMDSFF